MPKNKHGRKNTEKSAESFRKWVYRENPVAKGLIDPDVVKIKKRLGHI